MNDLDGLRHLLNIEREAYDKAQVDDMVSKVPGLAIWIDSRGLVPYVALLWMNNHLCSVRNTSRAVNNGAVPPGVLEGIAGLPMVVELLANDLSLPALTRALILRRAGILYGAGGVDRLYAREGCIKRAEDMLGALPRQHRKKGSGLAMLHQMVQTESRRIEATKQEQADDADFNQYTYASIVHWLRKHKCWDAAAKTLVLARWFLQDGQVYEAIAVLKKLKGDTWSVPHQRQEADDLLAKLPKPVTCEVCDGKKKVTCSDCGGDSEATKACACDKKGKVVCKRCRGHGEYLPEQSADN